MKDMLLIEESSVLRLYREMMEICSYFVLPFFTIGIVVEYFGELNFSG